MSTEVKECPYKDVCADRGAKCETCANNPKRSYYRPREPYYVPCVPVTPYPDPYWPSLTYYPYWTWGTTTSAPPSIPSDSND